jgi:hypothetical protein
VCTRLVRSPSGPVYRHPHQITDEDVENENENENEEEEEIMPTETDEEALERPKVS